MGFNSGFKGLMYAVLHVKYPLFLSGFVLTRILSTDFVNMSNYQK